MGGEKINIVNNDDRQRSIRFRAEIWDQMQFFFQEYNDHQLHAVIFFKELLDQACLQKAVYLTMKIVPILGSRFRANKFRPYWEKMESYTNCNPLSLVDCSNPAEEINRFLTAKTNEFTGPQLMVKIIRSSQKDILCIVLNHMVCDGAGFKNYLYLLGSVYTKLLSGGENIPEYYNGSRSSKQIYRQFKFRDRLKIFLLPNAPQRNRNNIYFPFSEEKKECRPFIATQILSRERFQLLKAYAKQHTVTINDLILTAYYRVLSQILDLNPGESLTISCMVDLRRYLPSTKSAGICNLSSMIICNIGPEIGVDFKETLMKVNQAMNNQKNGYPGLHGLSTLNALFKLLPFTMLRKIMKMKFVNPVIALTNIGIIDAEKLLFGKTIVEDAFITGSIKYQPYFQLALTSFNNTITFSVNLYGTENDRVLIQEFLSQIDKELQSIS